MTQYYASTLVQKYRVWIFFGDLDSGVPYTCGAAPSNRRTAAPNVPIGREDTLVCQRNSAWRRGWRRRAVDG